MTGLYVLSDSATSSSYFCNLTESVVLQEIERFRNADNAPFFTQLFNSVVPACQSHISQCFHCYFFVGAIAEMLELYENAVLS